MGRSFTIGLALGGGAARAVAHIGVLEALEQHGIAVDVIAGTSMGAIIGSLYAIEPDTRVLRGKMLAYVESEAFKESRFNLVKDHDEEGAGIFYRFSQMARKGIFYSLSITRKSLIHQETADKNISVLIPDIAIEDLKIPFCATSTDLNSGEEFVFTKGPLRQAIAASCALPGILPPVEVDGRFLVDGGWVDAVPVEPAVQLGADFVIGVDIDHRFNDFDTSSSGLEIVFRADMVTRHALAREKLKMADIILRPKVENTHWADFSRIDDQIQKGRDEVIPRIAEIKKAIRAKRFSNWWRSW
jgi:NTE family protein